MKTLELAERLLGEGRTRMWLEEAGGEEVDREKAEGEEVDGERAEGEEVMVERVGGVRVIPPDLLA